jgi:hypothetical protein
MSKIVGEAEEEVALQVSNHSCAELGVATAAIRYLTNATSISLWSWIIEPAANILLGSFGSCVSELPINQLINKWHQSCQPCLLCYKGAIVSAATIPSYHGMAWHGMVWNV